MWNCVHFGWGRVCIRTSKGRVGLAVWKYLAPRPTGCERVGVPSALDPGVCVDFLPGSDTQPLRLGVTLNVSSASLVNKSRFRLDDTQWALNRDVIALHTTQHRFDWMRQKVADSRWEIKWLHPVNNASFGWALSIVNCLVWSSKWTILVSKWISIFCAIVYYSIFMSNASLTNVFNGLTIYCIFDRYMSSE